MRLNPKLLIKLYILLIICCSTTNLYALVSQKDSLQYGLYRAQIIGWAGNTIPFQFEIRKKLEKNELTLINASERVIADNWTYFKDSIIIHLPYFDAEFRLQKTPGRLKGYWVRHLPLGDKKYELSAIKSSMPRFSSHITPKVNVSGLWDIQFKSHHYPNVGEFNQEKDGRVTGSILSLTGDYRYLEGRVNGDSLYLSTFDGAHAYMFKVRVNLNTHMLEDGKFFALSSAPEMFTGIFNPKAHLEDVYNLTRLKPGLDTLSFHFKNLIGEDFRFPNTGFRGKITIIQILGSWCPNCLDEAFFLKEFYAAHKNQVNIIGLAYERSADWELSRNLVQKWVNRIGIEYPVLITGFKNQNSEVLASLPALNNFEGFPTMLVIDKRGKVQKIHTGFSGPGTGKYYKDFVNEFNTLFQELYNEN